MAMEKVTITYSSKPIFRSRFGDDMIGVKALELDAPQYDKMPKWTSMSHGA